RIGFVGDGGLNDVLVHFIVERLEKENIRGLRLVPLSSGGRDGAAALLSVQCDALVMTPPEAIEARIQGCAFIVDFAEFGLNYGLGGIATRRRTIQEAPDVVRKFVRAYVEGMNRYRTDREFTVQVQREYSGIAERKIAEETYDITQPGMPAIPYPVVEALGAALKIMSRDLPAALTADPRRFVEDLFVRELQRRL
ncbi:MAG TPA: ABC transporter substrate-binding protein, partial [Candidatus Binatia bacterium]